MHDFGDSTLKEVFASFRFGFNAHYLLAYGLIEKNRLKLNRRLEEARQSNGHFQPNFGGL